MNQLSLTAIIKCVEQLPNTIFRIDKWRDEAEITKNLLIISNVEPVLLRIYHRQYKELKNKQKMINPYINSLYFAELILAADVSKCIAVFRNAHQKSYIGNTLPCMIGTRFLTRDGIVVRNAQSNIPKLWNIFMTEKARSKIGSELKGMRL